MRPEGRLEYLRFDLNSEMTELRWFKASRGDDEIGRRDRVSTIPSGVLGSLWQPFIDIDDELTLCC